MEFMGEGRELVPDGALPLVEAPCWFCSPSVSMAAEETDEASVSQTQDETNTSFSLCESLMDRGGKKTPHLSRFLTNSRPHRVEML